MRKRYAWSIVVVVLLMLMAINSGVTQTPDEETPAEEQACDKYLGEGARYGLCVAYCEAQDCDDLKKGDESCLNIAQNFIDWSVKKGYVKGPKGVTIDCKVKACSQQDMLLCKGVEIDCFLEGECTPICTRTFLGFFPGSDKPMCMDATPCKKCVSDVPKID